MWHCKYRIRLVNKHPVPVCSLVSTRRKKDWVAFWQCCLFTQIESGTLLNTALPPGASRSASLSWSLPRSVSPTHPATWLVVSSLRQTNPWPSTAILLQPTNQSKSHPSNQSVFPPSSHCFAGPWPSPLPPLLCCAAIGMAAANSEHSNESDQKDEQEPEVVGVIVGRTCQPRRLLGLLPNQETLVIDQPYGGAHWQYVR